ncbi:hypothetical protein BKA69DRAFT_1051752 [Paraphysoderma sedebokerense]|nr:hypothetical protein BKA69DRAFT_1051752 [Paraphysoderma sedebokerense]
MTLSHLSIPLPVSLSAIKMSLLSVPSSLSSALPTLAFWFFTFLVALSIIPRLFPKHGPLKFICRSIIMYTLIFSFSFMGMVVSFASYWTKWRYSVSTYVSRLLTVVAKCLVGVNVRVIKESESKEEEGEDIEWKEGMPAVYVVNHQSTMDVMVCLF